MLPEFKIVNRLPESLSFIAGDQEGEYHYRKLQSEHPEIGWIEQVIIEDSHESYTFYHGHWPDHPCIKSLDDAKTIADSKAEFWLSFEPCDN